MSNNKKQTAVDTLIVNFKESISYLESSLDCCNDELTKAQLKVRLSQARYFLTYAIEAKEMEKEQMIKFAWNCHLKREMFEYQIEEKYNETYGGNK
jgi:heterodisulfide reductase subunit B